jgi:MFS family permease
VSRSRGLHYAWVVLGVSFLAVVVPQGLRIAFGAFVPSWERDFATNRATLATLSSVSFLVYGFGQPITGRLADRFGGRNVLTAGVLMVGLGAAAVALAPGVGWVALAYIGVASVGFAFSSGVAPVSMIVRWFETHRGTALGLMATAIAVGQLVVTPVALLLIVRFGWRTTMDVFAVYMIFVLAPLTWLLVRSRPESKSVQPLGAGDAADPQRPRLAMRGPSSVPERSFWLLAIPFFVCGATTSGLIDTHLVPLAHDHNLPVDVTAASVATLAAFNVAGTLAAGWLADRFPRRTLLGIVYAVRAFSLIVLINVGASSGLLFVFAVIFGLADFSTVAPTYSLGAEYFGVKRGAGTVVGVLSLAHQVGSALGAGATGLLYQLTGSYTFPLVLAMLILAGASVISFLLPAESRRPIAAAASA